MNICVLSGASSGFGHYIAETLKDHIEVDEVWLIARRENLLNELKDKLNIKCKILPYDLTKKESIEAYKKLLDEQKPNIKYLFNVSGFGTFGAFKDIDIERWDNMIDLNIKSLVDMTYYSIKYMSKDSHIINISSMSAFAPLPYLSVYAASKSFVLSFTRGINAELKKEGIHAHALCPYWTNTNFINVAKSDDSSIIKHFGKIYETNEVIDYMWKKIKKNKEVIIPGAKARWVARGEKIFSHSFAMNVWLRSQNLK